MTRPSVEVRRVLALHGGGLSVLQISQRLNVPRRTVRDWVAGRVPRREITGGCVSCGAPSHAFHQLPPAYVYLLGLYLGDGSIASHPRGVYKLRLTLDASYPRIIQEAMKAIGTVLPANRVNAWPRPYGDVEVYSYSKTWPCLLPQHGPGKKHLRPIKLTAWQQGLVGRHPCLLLQGLLNSDGCRFLNTGRGWSHPRYSFTNLSPDIRSLFIEACEMVGLRWTRSGGIVYVSRKADVASLDGFVGPKA